MHGVIAYELERFAIERIGAQGWRRVLKPLGLEGATFTPVQSQPDSAVVALIGGLAREESTPVTSVLEDFGRWIAPRLLEIYAPLIDPAWDAAELLEHAEDVIHRAVRMRDPDATPPVLDARRLGPQTIELDYSSPRRLCAFATGLIDGLASSFGRTTRIRQDQCMEHGAPLCTFVVDII